RDADRALVRRDLFDQTERNDVARVAGIFDGLQRAFYIIWRERAHECIKLPATQAKASSVRRWLGAPLQSAQLENQNRQGRRAAPSPRRTGAEPHERGLAGSHRSTS